MAIFLYFYWNILIWQHNSVMIPPCTSVWEVEIYNNPLVSCPLACTESPKSPVLGWQHASPLVKENFYQYQEHLKFVCILFSSTLNNFRSQITGVSDQSASWLVLETQECYATLWYSTSIFQFNNHLTCTRAPRDEGGRERNSGKMAGEVYI